MIKRDAWVIFNRETGALDAMFFNECNATQFSELYHGTVSKPQAMILEYNLTDHREEDIKKLFDKLETDNDI